MMESIFSMALVCYQKMQYEVDETPWREYYSPIAGQNVELESIPRTTNRSSSFAFN